MPVHLTLRALTDGAFAALTPRGAAAGVSPRSERRAVAQGDGTPWVVYEVQAADVPGARGPSCLVFDNAACVRRVWDFPPDWATLSDAELIAVSLRR